jgi:hypothetical protein
MVKRMTPLSEIEKWLHDRLPGVLVEHRIPGAAIAVAVGEPEGFVRLRGDTFVRVTAQQGVHGTVVFLGNDGQGHPQYLHGGRVSRRVAG